MVQLLLNEYENLGEIGSGSFATVYKVCHSQLNYIRAIRVLNTMVPDEKDKSYQTFLNECKALLQLGNGGHPNIVRIYQPRLLQNHALVEMDYIDGCDLNDYLKEQNHFVPTDEVLRFANDIGGALAYCHVDCYQFSYDINKTYEYKLDSDLKGQKFTIELDPDNGRKDLITDLQRRELIREYGVMHNDLHSKNIMRKRYDGSYVLLDFGLAIQDGKAVKSSSRRDGAIEYKAPEKGEKDGIISERSDIYSFGILLYEMLAGQVPFPYNRDKYSREEEALYALSLQHEKTPPPAIEPLRRAAFEAANPDKTYVKDYPDWLEQMIIKCLSKNPEDRYSDAKEFLYELKTRMANTNIVDYKAINELKSLNNSLNNELSSLAHERTELQSRISSLTEQLANVKPDTNDEEVQQLKNEIATLKSKTSKKRPNTVWITLCLLFAVSAAVLGVMYGNIEGQQSPDVRGLKFTISQLEKDKKGLQTQLDNANASNKQLAVENQTLKSNSNNSTALANKQKEIDRLQAENTTLKANQHNLASEQSTITANQNEINRLKQEVDMLKVSNQQKDQTIATQQRQLQTAQTTIEKLANQ